jgi:hypothetical protein
MAAEQKFIEVIEYRSIRSRGVTRLRPTGNTLQVGISSIVFGEFVGLVQVKEGKEPLPLGRAYLANGTTVLGAQQSVISVNTPFKQIYRLVKVPGVSGLRVEEYPIFVNPDQVELITPAGSYINRGERVDIYRVKTPVSSFITDEKGYAELVGLSEASSF